MEHNKPDRRSVKTQKCLKVALAELLQEKKLQHITVQEVSDKADVHRVTFYKHYYDIYDLYDQFENEVLSDLGLLMLKFHENPSRDFGLDLVDYIADNPHISKMMFSPYNTGELRHNFLNMIEGIFRLIQTENNSLDIHDVRTDYYAAYWACGCMAVIEKWVQKDFDQPKDFIIQTILELDAQIERFIKQQFENK